MRTRLLPLVLVATLVAGCSDDDTSAPGSAPASTPSSVSSTTEVPAVVEPAPSTTAAPDLPAADFVVSPGTEQVTVTGARPGEELTIVDSGGAAAATGTVDETGALLVRELAPGAQYVVRATDRQSEPVVTLTRDDHPAPEFYAEQRLVAPGFGYLTTRDGTTLSATVWLPGPVEDGPYPTVVEYSGYTPSDPDAGGFSDLFTALGYAYVGVNMRGTGCSGGSFRFFEYSQSLDGYDVIETVAAQPWAANAKAGMVGVSYPGISQLFVAQTQPPSLAAITPLSVIDDSFNGTLYPGGLLNTGFAVEWTSQRMEEARPEGQEWAAARIAAGDEQCAANQGLRLQNPDLVAEIRDNPYWVSPLGEELAPRTFVDRIEVPVLLAGAWQDEQTGGRFPTMLDRFSGSPHVYATLVNGLHTDSISPAVLPRLVEFLDLYVALRTPSLDVARNIAPILAQGLFGTSEVVLPPDRFTGMSYSDALAAFEADQPIQVLFEQGAADGFTPRTPLPRWSASFDAWPVPGAEATAWYLGSGGALSAAPPTVGEASTDYLALPDATPATFFDGSSSGVWSVDVVWDWQAPPPGTAAEFTSEPLAADTVVVGSGSVDLWIASNTGDTDLEVTISEVRPDGDETYVQSGWLRASHRTLDDAASTELRPVHTHLEADASPLPEGELTPVRVELFPFAHAFRAGSRIRIGVDAPGNSRAEWEFETIAGGEQVTIAHDAEHPSRVVLPVVAGLDVPAGLAACDALRGQPCRSATR
jgi:predicted acyl esterase